MENSDREFVQAWRAVWSQLAVAPPSAEAMLSRYHEPQRHYHNADHIVACLRELAAYPDQAAVSPAILLAIFYHDAVYDPHKPDNEAQSAALARTDLANMLPARIDDISRLILITQHRAAPAQNDERLILDVDLSILGQPPDIFNHYEQAIRQEYAFVPEETFRSARARILQGFLTRERLFHTPYFASRYESRARENLAHSIQSLTSEPPANSKTT